MANNINFVAINIDIVAVSKKDNINKIIWRPFC